MKLYYPYHHYYPTHFLFYILLLLLLSSSSVVSQGEEVVTVTAQGDTTTTLTPLAATNDNAHHHPHEEYQAATTAARLVVVTSSSYEPQQQQQQQQQQQDNKGDDPVRLKGRPSGVSFRETIVDVVGSELGTPQMLYPPSSGSVNGSSPYGVDDDTTTTTARILALVGQALDYVEHVVMVEPRYDAVRAQCVTKHPGCALFAVRTCVDFVYVVVLCLFVSWMFHLCLHLSYNSLFLLSNQNH